MLGEGDAAPRITVRASDGKDYDIGAPGRPLVLFFYPRDMTPGCTVEARDFTALAEDFAKAGVAVLGVSRDSMARHDKFTAKEKLTVPLVADEDGAVSDAFGAWGRKKFMGREFLGMIRSTFLIGADGRIVRAWPKVKVKGHAEEVLAVARPTA